MQFSLQSIYGTSCRSAEHSQRVQAPQACHRKEPHHHHFKTHSPDERDVDFLLVIMVEASTVTIIVNRERRPYFRAQSFASRCRAVLCTTPSSPCGPFQDTDSRANGPPIAKMLHFLSLSFGSLEMWRHLAIACECVAKCT